MKKPITVVAAIIENDNNEILCALRSPDMTMPNLWEFPGGKVERGEGLFTALQREIEEELQCIIEPDHEVFNDHIHEYETITINLMSVKCRIISGNPVAKEHSKLIWLKRENLLALNWAPADLPAVNQLIHENG